MNTSLSRSARRRPSQAEIEAAVVPIGGTTVSPQMLTARLVDFSMSGAKLCCDEPVPCDRLWIAFTAEQRMIVEAEVIWSDYASAGPHQMVYGLSFGRVLSEVEFTRHLETLTPEDEELEAFGPSVREREECLFAIFRGHSPHGGRSSSVS